MAEQIDINNNTIANNKRDRIFIGEADFSFTYAFLKKFIQKEKHGNLGRVLATELKSRTALSQIYPKTFTKTIDNIDRLKAEHPSINIEYMFDFDVSALSSANIRIDRPKCIHFNYPFNSKQTNTPNEAYDNLRTLLRNCLTKFKEVQISGDHIHLSLVDCQVTSNTKRVYDYIDDNYQIKEIMKYFPYKLICKREFYSLYSENGYNPQLSHEIIVY